MSFPGTYRWVESHQEAEYTNWYPGGPHNRDDYDCVWKTFYIHNGASGWHDVKCSMTSYDENFCYYGQIHALCEAAK